MKRQQEMSEHAACTGPCTTLPEYLRGLHQRCQDFLYWSFWRDPRELTDCVSGLNPFLLARCHCTAPQRGNHLCWLFVSCVGEYDGTVVVGRSTVCDDIASRLLFVSPVTPTWCYVLCSVRLLAVVLLQSLQTVTGALVWRGV